MTQVVQSSFSPPSIIANRHIQTLYGPLAVTVKYHPQTWQSVTLTDGDFVELAWFGERSKRTLLILHGLEGSYRSHYVQRLLNAYLGHGWQVVVAHFRGCGRSLNRLPRSYHSGSSDDLADVLSALSAHSIENLYAIGFSLGGNVLLKWLGENKVQNSIRRAMAVSVPFKLDICADSIDRGFSRFYQKHLIDSLKFKVSKKHQLGESALPNALLNDLSSIRNFWQFDEHFTAPMNGFSGASDYYAKASSFPFIARINTPTLLLQALDDPFLSPEAIPRAEDLGPSVTLELSEKGGHVGFLQSFNAYKECFIAQRSFSFFMG
ncbi:hydrolase [Pleionea litopenaei]|uniref:Hydrolase n=1 Tax=Pleionea litopenaei TaxID=3070815 RepID=A0AA51RRV7_9GAMM|nr:hydrolase [Pleionea sp. HL-JVS1]WMS86461.1 hydrolase [Pleionea sp. HL-JVS1]